MNNILVEKLKPTLTLKIKGEIFGYIYCIENHIILTTITGSKKILK